MLVAYEGATNATVVNGLASFELEMPSSVRSASFLLRASNVNETWSEWVVELHLHDKLGGLGHLYEGGRPSRAAAMAESIADDCMRSSAH